MLVNNAGGGVIRPTLEHTEETLQATIDRNLWTALRTTLAALPHMRERGYGRIVFVGADSVRNGLDLHAVYNAAKGGVHAFARGLAREYARDGITVNTVAPSATMTPDLERFLAQQPEAAEAFLRVIPMGRPGSTRGGGVRRRLSRGRRGELHHRAGAVGQRRREHGLTATLPPMGGKNLSLGGRDLGVRSRDSS